mmetsp:Transcript_2204/g.3671  ORF Transcript_2204/g.3671 Transcript_2204/m.3671 type:complete len:384 (+) Transcript_2204:180-1331(+)
MVVVFFGGPMGLFGGNIGQGPLANGNEGLVLMAGLIFLTMTLPAQVQFIVPLISIAASVFPQHLERIVAWFKENKALLGFVVFSVFLLATSDVGSEDDVLSEPSRRRQPGPSNSRRQPHFTRPERTEDTDVEGEGEESWTGNVLFDFAISVLFLGSTLVLPRLWAMLYSLILYVLPASAQGRWRAWTRAIRPRPPPRGSIPASREAINNIENVEIQEHHLIAEGSPTGIPCPVCLDEMKVRDVVKRLPCKHMFHPNCVIPWLERHNSCPTCRYELETSDPTYEYERRERNESERRESSTSPSSSTPTTPSRTSLRQPTQRTFHSRQWQPAVAVQPRSPRHQEELDRLMSLTVVELKTLAARYHVNIAGCVEKAELASRLVGYC